MNVEGDQGTPRGEAPPLVDRAEEGQRPTALLPAAHLLRISLYWLGLTAIDAAVNLVLQTRVQYDRTLVPDVYVTGTMLAVISLGGTLIGIVVQPTVGYLSDFTESRWGRRKPYIVIGSLLDVVFLAGIAMSNTILALAAFLALLQLSTNTARGPFQGYVPDLVAEPQVATASAMVGMMQIVGNVTGLVIATVAIQLGNLSLALAAVAVIELLTMVSVVLRVGKGMPARPRRGRSWWTIARETWGTDILRERSYVWLLTSRLFFLTAGGILFSLATKYLNETHGLSQADAGGAVRNIGIIVAAVIVVVIVPASRLSDRFGRKPVIYAACGVGAAGTAIAALAPNVAIAYVGAALYGLANGTFVAVDWALMTDIIPRASSGRYMGLSNVATGASGPLSVAVGGIIADLGNQYAGIGVGMRMSLLVAAGLYVVAAWTLRPVAEPRRPGRRDTLPGVAAA